MIERTLTTLIFGNVVLESSLTGCSLRVYSEDMRSFSMSSRPSVELKAPLDEIRKNISDEERETLAVAIFAKVESELDKSYPGGMQAASEDLARWLSAEP